ncbi:MAG: cytochrome c oxidase subunit II [Melioribacteraceae bacterium]|nr:cytochrome c oxidase subunit II [Melioribacteraceae bacterium]MCF8354414.1 cytochrome c oxidase subunit II [Melioribacteraceae bacterium]MCF8392989.1 cytochrome c oxidase subunit II [Melioribacteraceae bacterium]MCF8417268.1 cytochrome c oxidase subunit II [Melioribacteraceae bacterium]
MLALLSGQAAARSTDTVDNVMIYIVVISVILLLGVTAAMVYFVFKYHRKKGHKPKDIHGSVILEAIWIGIPTLLVLSMFYYGYTGYKTIRAIPDDAFEINVKARMWEWEFNYENGKKTDTLFVPAKQNIKLNLESYDVNHSLYIPAFRIKEDVIAGRINYLVFNAEQTGTYDIACAEYCGLNHSMMYTAVVAMPQSEFDVWYNTKDVSAEPENIEDTSADSSAVTDSTLIGGGNQ